MTLEKILDSIKNAGKNTARFLRDNAKVGLMTAGLLVGGYAMSGEKAEGGTLRVYNRSSQVNGSYIDAKHIEGATENFEEVIDGIYYNNNGNPLQLYSNHPTFSSPTDKLKVDAKDPNSITDYEIILSTNGGFSGDVDNFLKFKIVDNTNFEWKNIFFNINGEKKDIKYLINIAEFDPVYNAKVATINLAPINGAQTGVYNSGTLEFNNHADLNRDGKVDFKDWAWISANLGQSGITKGSNPNELNDYADIDGNGTVDYNDVALFMNQWLWSSAN